jgi:hypothetical protein
MKQHPDRQPRRAVPVQRGNDDDRQTDQNFEGDWIDGGTPVGVSTQRAQSFSQRTQSNSGYLIVDLCVPLRKPSRPLRKPAIINLELASEGSILAGKSLKTFSSESLPLSNLRVQG